MTEKHKIHVLHKMKNYKGRNATDIIIKKGLIFLIK